MAKFEIIPRSKKTVEGKWVPEARVRIYHGSDFDETPMWDAENKLFDTQEEADAHSMALGRRFLEKKGYV